MIVNRHAEKALVSMGHRMPVPASVIIHRLKSEPAPSGSKAIEVCQLKSAVGHPDGSNGDTVVVVIRDARVITAMLRRSWNQPFTPESMRVDEIERWK
jgi:hypothetical protein